MKKYFYSKQTDRLVEYDTTDDTIDILDMIFSDEEKVEESEIVAPKSTPEKKKPRKNSKFSDADKISIENMLKKGISAVEIAKRFGVVPQTIYNLKARSKIHISSNGTTLVDVKASISGKPVFDEYTFGLIKDCKADDLSASEIAERYEIARDDVVLAMMCESYADYRGKFVR